MKNKKVWGIILLFTLIFFILSQTNFQVYAESDSSTIDISDSSVGQTLPTGVSYAGNVFTITSGGSITVIGTTTTNTIVVETGVTNLTLTLSGTSITSSSKSPISIQGNSNVSIVLSDGTTNTLKGAFQKAGLSVPSGSTVNISGTGTLNATGGIEAAGIGGGYKQSGGTISIISGTVNAAGGNGAAGIGGGYELGNGGTINIIGGEVTATGGTKSYSYIVEGAAGIGGGYLGTGGNINIMNATVTAKGGTKGAGIGGGGGHENNKDWGLGGVIEIDNAIVKATGGSQAAGIGGGYNGAGGNITIKNDANVEAKGFDAAGIGGGYMRDGGTITITGSIVNASGLNYGSGIGGGYMGSGGTVTISGSSVYAKGRFGSGIGGGAGANITGGIIIIDNSSAVTAVSESFKCAIDAIPGSSGYIINAKLNYKITDDYSSYIKLASTSLELPQDYFYFAFSATTDSSIKAYLDTEFKTVLGNIVTEVDDKTLIPVTDLSVSPTSITQVKIVTANEEQNPKNSDATLSNLTINGTTINNFASNKLAYNIELAAGTSIVPTVVATVTDTGKASADVTTATSLPGTTTVLVTAEDKTTTKTYTINFTVASENNPAPSAPSESSSDDSSSNYYEPKVDILVNGKNETSAQITTTRVNDKTVTKITVDDKKVEEKLKGESRNTVITIPVNNKTDVVIGTLNGQTVKNMENKEAVLEVKKENVTYTLPASQINIDSVSGKIGKQVELKDIEVNVKISEPTAEILKKVEDTINKNNYSMVVKPIEFEITCSSGNQTVEVSRFNSYVERIIEIPKGIDPSKITTGIVINEDGTFSHIPTNVYIQDNKYYAKLNSLTNSTYSVIWNPINVASVENHWSKEAVNDMASRLVVKNPETFSPDYNITRGEFADYITKALGIYRTNTIITKKYSDISSENEIAIAVTIALEYGIIKGYPDNTFRPDALITREEAMTMYARAMGIVKLNVEDENRIQSFQDKELISSWAYESVKSAVGAKVFNGKSITTLDPQGTFTSAESATAIRNLLIKAKLINE